MEIGAKSIFYFDLYLWICGGRYSSDLRCVHRFVARLRMMFVRLPSIQFIYTQQEAATAATTEWQQQQQQQQRLQQRSHCVYVGKCLTTTNSWAERDHGHERRVRNGENSNERDSGCGVLWWWTTGGFRWMDGFSAGNCVYRHIQIHMSCIVYVCNVDRQADADNRIPNGRGGEKDRFSHPPTTL